jgi:hypothetical protein
VPYQAFFIEQEPDNFEKLSALLMEHHPQCMKNIKMRCGDHVDLLPRLIGAYLDPKPQPFGVLYYDFTTQDFDRSLRCLTTVYNSSLYRNRLYRIDCILYLSATAIKRIRGAFENRASLLDYMSGIGKKHWLVREPSGQHQYTFLVGTNWPGLKGRKSIKLFPINESPGREIFEKLNYTSKELEALLPYRTYREYLQHPRFLKIREQVMNRAGGMCERCHQQQASEPHHVKYPPWGEFDVPENLLALCHQCHCEIHGKAA